MATDKCNNALEKGINCNPPTQLLIFGYTRSILTDNIYDIVSFIIIGYYFDNDLLELQNNKRIQKVLSKQIGILDPIIETVKLSMQLTKFNRKNKEHMRILLLTNEAIYNFKSNELNHFQRRTCLENIQYITIVSQRNGLVIHTVSDNDFYDYNFWNYQSFYNQHIASVLAVLYQKSTNKSLPIYIDQKPKLFLTRKQQLSQYEDLVRRTDWTDEIDSSLHAKITKYITPSTQKPKLNDFEFITLVGMTRNGKIIKLKMKCNNEIFTAKIMKKDLESMNRQNLMNISIHHPFLPHLSFVFETEEKIYYLYKYDHSEYYRLYEYLQNGQRLSESEAVFYVSAITSVLGYLHSIGIIYNNLKTENILIDKNGNIYLNLMDEDDMYGICSEYLPPEMIANLQNFKCTKAIDWYCLGILLYELIVGITPFYDRHNYYERNPNLDELYLRIKENKIQFPKNMSNCTKDLITKLLQKNVNKRLGSGSKDAVDIQNHDFFKDMNFDKLINGEIKPPFKPKVQIFVGLTFTP